MKASRNKTIDISLEEGSVYLERCLFPAKETSLSEILDKTLCGDLFATLPLLPQKCVDLLIADPPYNLHKDFHGGKFKKTSEELYEEYTDSWVRAVLPLLKEKASVYVCCDWESSPAVARVLKRYFHLRNRITWQREKGRGAAANWKNGMEDIWFATLSKEYTFNVDAVRLRRKVIAPYRENGRPKGWLENENGKFRDTCPSNFWDDISIPYWSMAENTAHPTQKPEKLLAKLILASSNPGDMVFDPFLGSGSTSVTAKKLNRRYAGVEINPQYCIWAEKRLENAELDKSIQGFTDGVFWERNTNAVQKSKKK